MNATLHSPAHHQALPAAILALARSSARELACLIGLWLCAVPAQAQSPIGTVTHLSGTLVATDAAGKTRALSVKSPIQVGETLSTQDKTYARVKFQDGAEVVMRPDSQLAVNQYAYAAESPAQDNQALSLLKGGLRMVTGLLGKRNPDRVSVGTPTATIGIRGTHFGLLLCQSDCLDIPTVSGQAPADGLHVDVAAGAIAVTNPAGEQIMQAGQFGFVQGINSPPVVVPPSQGIQVTMPQSISQNNSDGRSVGRTSHATECVVQ